MSAASAATRVLVAARSPSLRRLLAGFVVRHGHGVVEAGDADAATAILADGSLDLALIDLAGGDSFAGLLALGMSLPARVGVLAAADRPGFAIEGVDVTVLRAPVQPVALAVLLDACHRPAPGGPGPLASAALEDLRRLGGSAFVRDVVAQFLVDADAVMRELRAAQRATDAVSFQDRLHALRSGAANVGARDIYDRCLGLRAITAAEIGAAGPAHLEHLDACLATVRHYAARAHAA